MIAKWAELSELLLQKNMRERGIVAFLILTVLYGVSDFFLLTPMNKEIKDLEAIVSSKQKEITQLSAQETVLAQALTNDPNAEKKREIERLEAQVKQLDESLEKLSVGLIQARKLPEALQAVLKSSQSLKLIGMETKKPRRLEINNLQEDEEPKEEPEVQEPQQVTAVQMLQKANGTVAPVEDEIPEHEQIGVYKYTVALEFEGKYFEVIRYLQALEQLPWKIYWQQVDYEVLRYPKARVSLEVYTLSTEQGVLGV